ncbi:MAG: ferritin-like domain-containing protein, partial [Nocardioidaceae bacterium]|nr:ferritin-like domain-containing protein [Nocardioidaceae bacterium]
MSAPSGSPNPQVAALQTTLAAEHAAVFVYGALGARTSLSGQPALYRALTAAYSLHRDRRDELSARVQTAGADPVAA